MCGTVMTLGANDPGPLIAKSLDMNGAARCSGANARSALAQNVTRQLDYLPGSTSGQVESHGVGIGPVSSTEPCPVTGSWTSPDRPRPPRPVRTQVMPEVPACGEFFRDGATLNGSERTPLGEDRD